MGDRDGQVDEESLSSRYDRQSPGEEWVELVSGDPVDVG
jgi:hypothetical protein